TAVDTDFTAKLIDVYPPNSHFPLGFDLNIWGSIVPMRYPDSLEKAEFVKPGAGYKATIHPYPTANAVPKGHRNPADGSRRHLPRVRWDPDARRAAPAAPPDGRRGQYSVPWRRPRVAHRAADRSKVGTLKCSTVESGSAETPVIFRAACHR